MSGKWLMKGFPKYIPDLEEPCPICPLTKATKITKGATIDVSKSPPGFMLQMYFVFFNVESICGFTSTFVDICYATSYPLGFLLKIKLPLPHLGILKCLVITLSHQYNKVAFVLVDEYGSLSR